MAPEAVVGGVPTEVAEVLKKSLCNGAEPLLANALGDSAEALPVGSKDSVE